MSLENEPYALPPEASLDARDREAMLAEVQRALVVRAREAFLARLRHVLDEILSSAIAGQSPRAGDARVQSDQVPFDKGGASAVGQ
jgi:hypothetical protein